MGKNLTRWMCLMAVTCCVVAALAYENDGPGRTASSKMLLAAAGNGSGFAPPEASDVRIVVTEGGNLGQQVWTGGTISVPFDVERYFGQRDKLIKSKALPETVQMTMIVWDVDSDSSYSPAEYDEVFVNGEKVGVLSGIDGTWTRQSFMVKTKLLKFPDRPQAPAHNEVTIKVATKGGNWVTKVDWVSFDIPAAPPIILSHGIMNHGADLAMLASTITSELGLPAEAFDQENGGNDAISVIGNLKKAVKEWKDKWKVDKVNLVCHSMGGLRARQYAESANDVFGVFQIATPNGGSPIADFMIDWRAFYEEELQSGVAEGLLDKSELPIYREMGKDQMKRFARKLTCDMDIWSDKAMDCLQTSYMAGYNRSHPLNPRVRYGVVAGDVQSGAMNTVDVLMMTSPKTIDKALDGLLDLLYEKMVRDNPAAAANPAYWMFDKDYLREQIASLYGQLHESSDLVVPVWSAHTLVPAVAGSPVRGGFEEAWHSGLVKGGARRVVALLKDDLVRRKQHETAGASAKKMSLSLKGAASGSEEPAGAQVKRGIARNGAAQNVSFGITEGNAAVMALSILGGSAGITDFSLTSPSGAVYRESSPGVLIVNEDSVSCLLTQPEKGTWTMRFVPEVSGLQSGAVSLWTATCREKDSAVFVRAFLEDEDVQIGGNFRVRLCATWRDQPLSGTAVVRVTDPDGQCSDFPLSCVGDGEYMANVQASMSGRYALSVVFSGNDPCEISRRFSLQGVAFDPQPNLYQSVSSSVEDTDGDGFYDQIKAHFTLKATRAASYRVMATLTDANGRKISESSSETISCSGAGVVQLPVVFNGFDVFAHGPSSGYYLNAVKIFEVSELCEAIVAQCQDLYLVSYDYSKFEHDPIRFAAGGSDEAKDINGDGIYDELTVVIPLQADSDFSGQYDWSAALEDREGRILGYVTGEANLPGDGGTSAVKLVFPGSDISQADLEGPYYVRDFILWNGSRTVAMCDEYATRAYSIESWGGKHRHMTSFDFKATTVIANEGGKAAVVIAGGPHEGKCSAKVYLTMAGATAADLNLPKGMKFPLTVTWDEEDESDKVITIPLKSDSKVEGDERFYLTLVGNGGISIGPDRFCQVVVKDMSVPSVSLATAANSTGLKVKTSGSGKWKAANGNAYYVSGENRGGYHLVTPKLAKGKQAKLTFSGVKGKGDMVVQFRFTGDAAERTSSTLKIYAGKTLMKTYYHTSVGSRWQEFTIHDSTTSSHTYSYVFTQGSDSATHVELVGSYFQPKGKPTPFMVYVTTLNSNYGSVTGMGFYRSEQTVKIAAKANPGHVFKGWYKWSDKDGKYVYWSKTAKKSFKAKANLDIAAMFAPYATVTPLSWQPERGTVSGGGACAPGKKVTLKAKAKSGYVFAGWYLNGNRVSLSATYKAPCPSGNVIYYAYFVTASEDKKSVVASVGGLSFAAGGAVPVTKATQTATCGVTVKWPVAAAALSSTSVKVTGLPTGLKYDTKKKAIVGVPTKTGTKTATVAVTTAGKSTVKFSLIIKVNPLPSWAKGNFEGFGDADGKPRRVTFTVSSVGKFSGTVAFAGETWKLAVSSYAAEYDGWFEANVKATKGKSSKSVRVIVYKSDHGGLAYSEVSGFEFDAVQNRWSSDPSLKALAAQLKGQVVKIGDDLTVTIGKAGAVTAKLKTKQGTFSASATLLPVYGEDATPSRYFIGFRFAPNAAKKFKGAVRLVVLE